MADDQPNPSSPFRSEIVDRMRLADDTLELPGTGGGPSAGRIRLPRVFGFCRGVERALDMADEACRQARASGRRLFLLGQIIHNPWVNDYFHSQGVRILLPEELEALEKTLTANDVAIIPAFGVRPEAQRRLKAIGCQIVDTSCGDVRRLWAWARRAAGEGFGLLIFGRANHDETVVTKSLLAEVGGRYVIAGTLSQVRALCDLVVGREDPSRFRELFDAQATNADSLELFYRLAQVSQTTMLYQETMQVRQLVQDAFSERFGKDDLASRLEFQPTVCRATQDRQAAAVELCRSGCDAVIVVGGLGSSNTRHLYELARQYTLAYFIEDARAIHSAAELRTADPATGQPVVHKDWLPARRPLDLAVLAGASTPECVVGQVIERLADLMCGPSEPRP